MAEFFGKRHDNVLRDIENISSDLRTSSAAHLLLEDQRPDGYGRYQKTYDMTKDGFTLLVMGALNISGHLSPSTKDISASRC